MAQAQSALSILGCLLMLIIGIAQLFGCFALMEDYWGWHSLVAIAVMAVVLTVGAGFLVSVGCFFGALLVWKWPWWAALSLSAPGLVIFVLVTLGAMGVGGIAGLWRGGPRAL